MKQNDIDTKILEAIDRIARVQKFLLWDVAKYHGLTPLQAQILTFLSENKRENCNIKFLSLELHVSHSTVSDSVKTLLRKGLVKINVWEKNKHYKIIELTEKGKEICSKLMEWNYYLKKFLKKIDENEKLKVFEFFINYIIELRNNKVLLSARTCPLCKYFEKKENNYYCKLFKINLRIGDLRIDCPDFEEAYLYSK